MKELEASFETKITNVTQIILPVMMSSLSNEAYGLGLRSKIEVEFRESAETYIVNVRCDGTKTGCQKFSDHVTWLIQFYNGYKGAN